MALLVDIIPKIPFIHLAPLLLVHIVFVLDTVITGFGVARVWDSSHPNLGHEGMGGLEPYQIYYESSEKRAERYAFNILY